MSEEETRVETYANLKICKILKFRQLYQFTKSVTSGRIRGWFDQTRKIKNIILNYFNEKKMHEVLMWRGAICQDLGIYCIVVSENEAMKMQKSDGYYSLFVGGICNSQVAGLWSRSS